MSNGQTKNKRGIRNRQDITNILRGRHIGSSDDLLNILSRSAQRQEAQPEKRPFNVPSIETRQVPPSTQVQAQNVGTNLPLTTVQPESTRRAIVSKGELEPKGNQMPLLDFTIETLKTGLENALSGIGDIARVLPLVDPQRPLKRALLPKIVKEDDKRAAEIAENIEAWAETTIGADPSKTELKPAENFIDYIEPRRLIKTVGENLPLMATVIATTMANPVAGVALMAGVEGGQAKAELDRLKSEGNTVAPIYEDTVPLIVGAFNAALERSGIDKILKVGKATGLKGRFLSLVTAMVTEGTTETLQEANQMLSEAGITKKIPKDSWRRLGESFYAGTVLSFLFGGLSAATRRGERPTEREAEITEEQAAPEQETDILTILQRMAGAELQIEPEVERSRNDIFEELEATQAAREATPQQVSEEAVAEPPPEAEVPEEAVSEAPEGIQETSTAPSEREVNTTLQNINQQQEQETPAKLSRDDFIAQFNEASPNLTEQQRADVIAIEDAKAEAWARWTGTDPETYYADNIARVKAGEEAALPSKFQVRGKRKRGAIFFLKDDRAVITAFEKADVATFLHEGGHSARRMLYKARDRATPEFQEQLDNDIQILEDWVGIEDGQWTIEAEEKFARGFERFVREGKAPSNKLRDVFERFSQYLKEIYGKIRNSPIAVDLPNDVKKTFDNLLGGQEAPQTPVETRTQPQPPATPTTEAQTPSRPISEPSARTETPQRDLESQVLDFLKTKTGKTSIQVTERFGDRGRKLLAKLRDEGKIEVEERPEGFRFKKAPERSARQERGEVVDINDKGELVVRGKALFEERQEKTSKRKELNLIKDAIKRGVINPEGKAANINLKNIAGPEDIKAILEYIALANRENIEAARRGKISLKETEALADVIGMSTENLLKRRKGEAFNAEEATAARQLLGAHSKRVVDLAKKADTGTERDMMNFIETLKTHEAIQKQVSGIAAEAGRALSAFRIKAKGEKAVERQRQRNLERVIEALGGEKPTREIAHRLSLIDPLDQRAINIFIRDITKSSLKDRIFEVWINGLLSAPSTHIINNVGNFLTTMSRVTLERPTRAGIDLISAKIRGRERQAFFSDTVADVQGVLAGFGNGLQAAMKAFEDEVPVFSATPTEFAPQGAIKGKKGRIIRIPGRALMAADEFWKAVNYSGELHAQAYRKAIKEDLRGKARQKRYAELVLNPLDNMVKEADRQAFLRTFQTELTGFSKQLNTLRNRSFNDKVWTSIAKTAFRFIVPFYRTPFNIAKFGVEMSPLGYLKSAQTFGQYRRGVKKVKKEFELLQSGKIDEDIYQKRVEAIRIDEVSLEDFEKSLVLPSIGTGIVSGIAILTANGLVTGGGPDDPALRKTWLLTHQPYSFKFGNQWISYSRLEPFSIPIGLTADFVEMQDYIEDQGALASILAAISKNLTSKTYLRGLREFFEAVGSEEWKTKRFLDNFLTSFVPNIVSAISRINDPKVRLGRGPFEQFVRDIPELRKSLPPIRDVWGRPLISGETTTERFASPVRRRKIPTDWASKESVRLKAKIGRPGRILTIDSKKTELTSKQHDIYTEFAGHVAWQEVMGLKGNSKYKRLSDDKKRDVIVDIKNNVRRDVRELLKDGIRDGLSVKQIRQSMIETFGKIAFKETQTNRLSRFRGTRRRRSGRRRRLRRR